MLDWSTVASGFAIGWWIITLDSNRTPSPNEFSYEWLKKRNLEPRSNSRISFELQTVESLWCSSLIFLTLISYLVMIFRLFKIFSKTKISQSGNFEKHELAHWISKLLNWASFFWFVFRKIVLFLRIKITNLI